MNECLLFAGLLANYGGKVTALFSLLLLEQRGVLVLNFSLCMTLNKSLDYTF